MYEFDEKTMGMYKYGIQGHPVREQVKGIDIKLARKDRGDNFKFTVYTLDGRTREFDTDGRYTVGEIVDTICNIIRRR